MRVGSVLTGAAARSATPRKIPISSSKSAGCVARQPRIKRSAAGARSVDGGLWCSTIPRKPNSA